MHNKMPMGQCIELVIGSDFFSLHILGIFQNQLNAGVFNIERLQSTKHQYQVFAKITR